MALATIVTQTVVVAAAAVERMVVVAVVVVVVKVFAAILLEILVLLVNESFALLLFERSNGHWLNRQYGILLLYTLCTACTALKPIYRYYIGYYSMDYSLFSLSYHLVALTTRSFGVCA